MHDRAIFVDIAITEVDVGLTVHDSGNGGPCRRQVIRVHIVRDQGADQLVSAVAEQRFTCITHKDDPVVPIDHEYRVEHQIKQLGIKRF
ncbi:hypothetical protein ECTOBSL9_0237 [Ectothiorhodospira sp. BSL-9]|nr:hypothetical protein ECTOBSL9_0237 [Ectothiorhodospira sp. BSL-9]